MVPLGAWGSRPCFQQFRARVAAACGGQGPYCAPGGHRVRRREAQATWGPKQLGTPRCARRTARALRGAQPPFPACFPQRPPNEPTARQAPCERVHTTRSARVRGVSAAGWAGCDGRLAEVTGRDGRTGLRPRSPRSFSEEPRWAAPSARPHRRPPAPAGASHSLPLHWGHFSSLDFLSLRTFQHPFG